MFGFLFGDSDAATVENDTGALKGANNALIGAQMAAAFVFQMGNGCDGYSSLIGQVFLRPPRQNPRCLKDAGVIHDDEKI
jgi:hypothetical protein